MLDLLRKSARGWVAKFLLILLVASFGVWGISSSILNVGSNAVITVGETVVTPNEFRLAYDRQVAAVGQQLGTRLTSEQANAFGIKAQVYSQVIAGAALDEQAREMNLGLSSAQLAKYVAEDPAFHDFNGTFVRANFQRILRSVGMSEDDYLKSRARVAVRTQIVEAVSDGFAAPGAMIEALAQYEAETRDVDYLVLTKDILPPAAAPDEAALSAFFDANKTVYAAPEYRKITYVKLQSADIADPAAVAEDAVRADYEASKDKFRSPEKRAIDQLTFTDEAQAKAAAARLAAGESFDKLAEEQGKSATDIRIGEFTRTSLPDQSLAEAAFAIAAPGGTSQPVKGIFGTVILRVASITPESVKTYEELAPQLRKELALAEASRILLDVHDAYEDARAGGMTIEEAAASQKLKTVTIEAVDRAGRAPDGKVLTDIPESQALLRDAFEADPGVEIPPLNIGSDGFLWYEVVDIIPARDRELGEVRDTVIADWTKEKAAEALGARASELNDRLGKGAELEAIAAELGIAVESKFSLKRGDGDPVFGEAAVMSAFAGGVGHTGATPDTAGNNRILFKVKSVNNAAGVTSDTVPDEQKQQVSRRVADDILDQMIGRLQSDYGVSVNQALADQALSF